MTNNTAPLLELQNVSKIYFRRTGIFSQKEKKILAVDNISMQIQKGKTVGLVGESGSGKSTLARMILRLIDTTHGHIFFDGKEITNASEKELIPFRRKMQIIFQDPFGSLNPRMTIGETITEGLKIIGQKKKSEQRKELQRLLNAVGLSLNMAERYPHEFSGGQRQRVGIARALSVSPSFIICDEPVSALDVSIQAQILNLLKSLQERLNLTYLFISHNLQVIGYLCDEVWVMYRGQIVECASATDLFTHAAHPYTQLMLKTSTQFEQFKENSGKQESYLQEKGCAFTSLCDRKTEICKSGRPPIIFISSNHYVQCYHPN